MIWFLCALLAGIISVSIALTIQRIIPAFKIETIADVFFNIIVRTAIPEEASKFIVMIFFIALSKRWKRLIPIETKSDGAAAGFIIALGFAFFETAGYSLSQLDTAFFRAISAAPIHAACGIRIGIGASAFQHRKTGLGIWNIVLAILIHTVYNFIILNPQTPLVFLVLLIALSVISSLTQITKTT
jgi:RsiW-degrading membrane proteinase PrsW (M82 family)